MSNKKELTYGNGKIGYVEIPAVDIKVSAAFYQNVFGWEIKPGSNGRTTFIDGVNEVSGTWVSGRKIAGEPGLLISIMVDSVAETTDAITANNCKIVKQIKMDSGEEIAWFNDPAGNTMGLYQHPGGGNGKICYLEIPAEDVNRCADFYEAVFNWPLRDKGTENAAFDDGAGIVSGMWVPDRQPSDEAGLLVYVMMDSVADTVAAVIANGGKIIEPVSTDALEITARFSDPAGNIIGLLQNQQQPLSA